MEWVSVKDGLPEPDRELVLYEDRYFAVGWYSVKYGWVIPDDDSNVSEPTHWMLLSTPPAEKGEGE